VKSDHIHGAAVIGINAADIMSQDVPTMPRDFSLENYVHEVLRTGRRCHIVTGNGGPIRLVTFHANPGSSILIYTARVHRDRFLAFEGEGMTWTIKRL
jgi:hypothetical protein